MEIRQFVQEWFDLLSEHAPVDRLLPRLADTGLEMVFPERTLHGQADFRQWYADVGRAYADQTHTVEALRVRQAAASGAPPPAAGEMDLEVTVVWTARQTADDARLRMRAWQSWRLVNKPGGIGLAIVSYRVERMEPI